MYKSSN